MEVPVVSGTAPVRSARATQMLRLPLLTELNTTCVPSGDQAGSRSPESGSVSDVSAAWAAPPRSTREMYWRPVVTVATRRRPSADADGTEYSPTPVIRG